MSQHDLFDVTFAMIHELIDLGKFRIACECLQLIAEKPLGRGDSLKLFESWDKLRERSAIARDALGENKPETVYGWSRTGMDAMEQWEENMIRVEAQAKKAANLTDSKLRVDITYNPRSNRTTFNLHNGVIVELTDEALSAYNLYNDGRPAENAAGIIDKLTKAVMDARYDGPTTAGKGKG